MLTESCQNVAFKYSCETCYYNTGNKTNYAKHLLTSKHCSLTSVNKKVAKGSDAFICKKCNKTYKSRVGLWGHSKKCSIQTVSHDGNNSEGVGYVIQETTNQNSQQTLSMEVFMAIIKQNKEVHTILVEQTNKFMEKITELVAVPQNTIANCNNTNSNNSFNLNVFLNEHCKDAINMSEFIKSLAITSADLERTGKVGFVKGMSEIFINGLKQLDVNKRPIHCTDVKRESIYMKDEDKWEKDDKGRFHQAIQRLTVKNIKQLRNWEMENPEFSNVDSETYDKYFQITKHIMGGIGEDDKKFKDKIVSNVIHTVKIP